MSAARSPEPMLLNPTSASPLRCSTSEAARGEARQARPGCSGAESSARGAVERGLERLRMVRSPPAEVALGEVMSLPRAGVRRTARPAAELIGGGVRRPLARRFFGSPCALVAGTESGPCVVWPLPQQLRRGPLRRSSPRGELAAGIARSWSLGGRATTGTLAWQTALRSKPRSPRPPSRPRAAARGSSDARSGRIPRRPHPASRACWRAVGHFSGNLAWEVPSALVFAGGGVPPSADDGCPSGISAGGVPNPGSTSTGRRLRRGSPHRACAGCS